ncbi:MAG: hypothetical protein JO186_06775 [Actinobacteria bacterium]|nr:hypothetical protein [Actinomycetota bacterium]MBV8598619.1 hypothetical protein [Actinomycetota bacterium]
MRKWLVSGLALVALAGGGYAAQARLTSASVPRCPASWGYEALAKRVGVAVFCPTWLPQPLTSQVRSEYSTQPYVNGDGSYLVSYLWFEKDPTTPYEVHVNVRGFPGRTRIPACQDTMTEGEQTVPCFSDPAGTVRFGKLTATVYTANQGIDTWHVLYAWHYKGSLYTVSQHVAPPFTDVTVRRSLTHILRGLVLVNP